MQLYRTLSSLAVCRIGRCVALALLMASATPAAAVTPDEAINLVVKKLKSTGTLAPLVESIDWEHNYALADKDELAVLKISSAEQLKAYYAAKTTSNGQDRLEMLRKELLGSQGGQADPAAFESVQKSLALQQQAIKEGLIEATYQVLDVQRTGDRATVKLRKYSKGKLTDATIDLTASGPNWLMSYGSLFNPLAPEGMIDAIGPLPRPEQVLANW